MHILDVALHSDITLKKILQSQFSMCIKYDWFYKFTSKTKNQRYFKLFQSDMNKFEGKRNCLKVTILL